MNRSPKAAASRRPIRKQTGCTEKDHARRKVVFLHRELISGERAPFVHDEAPLLDRPHDGRKLGQMPLKVAGRLSGRGRDQALAGEGIRIGVEVRRSFLLEDSVRFTWIDGLEIPVVAEVGMAVPRMQIAKGPVK